MGLFSFSVLWRSVVGRGRLVAHMALFEIGRQARQPLYWISTILLFLGGVGLMAMDALGSSQVPRNAPTTLAIAVVFLSLPYVVIMAALAGDAAVRDGRSGFQPILQATPIQRWQHVLGRFLGVQAATVAAALVGFCGLLAGSAAPWVQASAMGPYHWPQIALVAAVMVAPLAMSVSAAFFCLAAITRSIAATTTAAMAFLMVFVASLGLLDLLDSTGRIIVSLAEPMGVFALRADVSDMTVEQQALYALPKNSWLILNRLAWLGADLVLLAVSLAFERRDDAAKVRTEPKAAPAPVHRDQAWRIAPSFAGGAWPMFAARLRWELARLRRSPSLWVMVVIMVVVSTFGLRAHTTVDSAPSLPALRILTPELLPWVVLAGLAIAVFHAADIVWRDRDLRVAEIIDASPVTDLALMAAKLASMAVVLAAVAAAACATAFGVQAWQTYVDGRPEVYFVLLVGPLLAPLFVLAATSIAVAALSPNRYVGWGIMAGLLALTAVGQTKGFSHPLWDFMDTPSGSPSEMNLMGDGTGVFWWFSLYWTLGAGALLTLAWLAWPRGLPMGWRRRWIRSRQRLAGRPALVGGALLLAMAAVGTFIFVNTNVRNSFSTDDELEAGMGAFEKAMVPLRDAPGPAIASMRVAIDLDPRRHALTARGDYLLENRTGRPLKTFHLDIPAGLSDWEVRLDGARQEESEYKVVTLTLDRPMAPGEQRRLSFETRIRDNGFGANGGSLGIVDNGSFLHSAAFMPRVGVALGGYLTDSLARERQGLPRERPTRGASDPLAPQRARGGADWLTSDITVTTAGDQIPVAPGRRVFDRMENGRRVVRFVSDTPMQADFSLQSARYHVRRAKAGRVDVEIYYTPGHEMNVERMVAAVREGLPVFEAAFGPYPRDHIRIIEYPAYDDQIAAMAWAGAIPYSEKGGFVADLRKPDAYDYVTATTLHELAHQWWGHQVELADARGARFLTEGLAEYSALMAMNRLRGPSVGNRGFSLAMSSYFRDSNRRREPEPAIVAVTSSGGENYVAYQRAALALLAVRARCGEDNLHRQLRGFVQRYRFRNAPYPTSEDLMGALKAACPAKDWAALEPTFRDPARRLFIGFTAGPKAGSAPMTWD